MLPWANPSSLFPNQSTRDSGDDASASVVKANKKTTVSANQPLAQFSPDASILFKLFKTCQQRTTANSWFSAFVESVKNQPWDLTEKTGSVTGKRRRTKRVTLDERTLLKARFASALHEMELSGLIRCSSTSTGSSGSFGTVMIERRIYTWV